MDRLNRPRGGFTLVELLITVIILGILAAIVVPSIADSRCQSEQLAFVSDVRIFSDAIQVYYFQTGEYPEDSSSGDCPAGLEAYVDEAKWETLTPIGGVWDCERNDHGITSGFGVDFRNGGGEDRDAAFMAEVDGRFDDGDIATGFFRDVGEDRYYYVFAD